jgi:tetratricopeptide (TPR) repeat protein
MEYSEQIERYIEGLMGEEEIKAFRKELSGNPQLSALVEDALRIQKTGVRLFAGEPDDLTSEVEESAGKDVASYREAGDDPLLAPEIRDFREKLREVQREQNLYNRSRNKPILKNRLWYYAAAMLILAVAIPLLISQYGKHPTCNSLYQSYYAAYPRSGRLLDQTRSDNDLLHAVELYKAGEYEESKFLLMPFLTSAEYGAIALFYSGLADMAMERYDDAIVNLERCLEGGREDLAAPARWYLGLCYLAKDDAAAALDQFKITGRNPEFSGKSEQIIKKIRKVPGFSEPE